MRKNKKETYKDMEIFYKLKGNNIIICYSQFDMGAKYKIYKRNEYNKYEHVISFDSVTNALNYAEKIFVA